MPQLVLWSLAVQLALLLTLPLLPLLRLVAYVG
jgi:hypothetical protein